MDKINPLLRTPRPFRDESMKGFIVRATEENGYGFPSAIFDLADVRVDLMTKGSVYTDQRWKNLSAVLNVDIPTLQELACLKGVEGNPPKAYNLFGNRIHKYFVRVSAPKLCPGCLRDGNYARKIWDLAAFTCCPVHKTILIDKCPNCSEALSWNRDSVSVCACGYDWRDAVLPEATDGEIILSRLILQACGCSESSEKPACGTDSRNAVIQRTTTTPLGSVRLGELLSAVHFIAGQQNGVVDATGKQYAAKLSHRQLHETLTNAIKVFENWPENYFKFLEECRGKNPNSERNSGRNSGYIRTSADFMTRSL